MRTIRKNNVSPFRSPKHIRWDRQRSDQELLHVATEYGKCWNPQHWHRLTQGYYDGFDDARTEYRRRQDEDLAATKERYRAEIEELKANWIPPDEAEAAIQEIYALRKERDELLESMDLLRKIGFPAMREKKLSEKLMGCAKRALNSSIAWTCCGRRPNEGMLRAFVQKVRGYLLRFGVGNPKDPLIKSTSSSQHAAERLRCVHLLQSGLAPEQHSLVPIISGMERSSRVERRAERAERWIGRGDNEFDAQ